MTSRRHPAAAPVPAPSAPDLDIVRAPGWHIYPWLRHGFSTRVSGVSTAYYPDHYRGELNLGWTKEDLPANVVENRRRFLAAVAGNCAPAPILVGVRQTHSTITHVVEAAHQPLTGALQTPDGRPTLIGDGLLTDLPGVMLGVGVADCVPVLVADVRHRAVAAFHAGWRGTLARIVEHGVAAMHRRYGSAPEDLIAAIGPSIGPCCYSVGEELRTEFANQFPYAPLLFLETGSQPHLDLWEANRRQLLAAGLQPSQITVLGECTACTGLGTPTGRKYFSHRAERGVTGRMMGMIGVSAQVR
jgi:YfiH family protein